MNFHSTLWVNWLSSEDHDLILVCSFGKHTLLKCKPALANLLLPGYAKLNDNKTKSYAEQDVYFSGLIFLKKKNVTIVQNFENFFVAIK